MTGPEPPRRPPRERQGLTNGNGIPRPSGLTNGLGRTNGTGRTNGLTNGLTNGVRGRTNGLTNGSGRTNGLSGLTNGLVNGTGRTNGTRGRTSGITNGRGATNGTGAINGLINGSYKKGLRQNRFGVITHKDLRLGLSIIVLALLLLGPFYLLLSSPTPASPTRITVDGGLGDWSGIGFLNDTVVASDANVKLRAYSALLEPSGYLSFAIRVEGIALGDTTGFDGFYIFIDKDANPATGFSAREIGAEYLVAVRGGNNAVSSAALYGFTGTDPDDWMGWRNLQPALARASVNSVEVQLANGDVDLGTSHSFLVAASNYQGVDVFGSVHFDERLRAVLVRQDPASPVVLASGGTFATLSFTAFGGPITVTQAGLTKDRAPGTLTAITGLGLPDGTPVTRDIQVAFGPSEANDYLVAHVDPALVTTTAGSISNVPVTVDGPSVVAYLGSAPSTHRIDGYFGDWTQLAVDTRTIPADRDVDIVNYGANRTGATAFVYADVAGRIFGGSAAPERFDRPTGGSGGNPAPPAPRSGEDVFRAFIDVDTQSPAGTSVLGVRADFMVEVRGVHGHVVSELAYQWSPSPGAWTPVGRVVGVAQDRTRMEASVDLSGIATGLMAMSIEATDWDAVSGATAVFNFLDQPGGGTRGAPLIGPMHGSSAASVEALPLSGAPTVDGDCSDSVYSGAGTFSDTGLSGKAGTSGSYLYLCIDVTSDTDNEAADQGWIYFDTDHSGGAAPDANDRRFYLISGSFLSYKGDGTLWVPCTSPDCDSGNGGGEGFSGHRIYEFKIRFANVWGTDTPSASQQAGFAVRAVDFGGSTYTWGSTSPPADLVPDTWGHITAPEFSDVAIPIGVVVVIYLVARRRRRDAGP